MRHLKVGLALVVILVVALLVGAAMSAEASKPTLALKASPTKCVVGTGVKFTVTVSSVTPAYEVRLYKKAAGVWNCVATATQVAADRYVAFAKPGAAGKRVFKAGFVNSKGAVTAYSNQVTVTVTN
jgi:hypothetical protein